MKPPFVAHLLPQLTGAVVGRDLVVLLECQQLTVFLSQHQTEVLIRVCHYHPGEGGIGLGRVNGKATRCQRVAESLERQCH